jgi:Caspase domain
MTAQTYRAVLVANSTFPADAYNLPDLEGPRNDPALLRDALCDSDVGVFAPDNVRLVTERTMSEVLAEAEDLLVSATRRDTLLIYYSGHGLLDQSGELFLCTRDTRADRLRSTAVKASDLRGMMDASAAGVTVVVLDCCHSGRFKGTNIPATLSGRGRFVVTSSRPGELANDADARNHASLFTHHLAEGIMSGAVDHDGDGVVTLSELYDYVRRALADEGRQVPQKRFEGDGDVALARRAAQQVPADLVDPAASAPILDLSETEIHLGEVGGDESLPPERVAVINRGGGTLEWTAESSAGWVEAVAEGSAVVLHLHPRPGPNRANVYVRDASGALKTIRVSVRVREPAGRPAEVTRPVQAAAPERREHSVTPPSPVRAEAEAVVDEPKPAPSAATPTVEVTVDEPGPAQPAATPTVDERSGAGPPWWRDPRWWSAAVALFSVLVGISMVATVGDLVEKYEDNYGENIVLRRKDYGGPLLTELLSGVALAMVGAVSLILLGLRRLSSLAAMRSMAWCLAIAVPWSLFFLGDAAVLHNVGDGWMLDEVGWTAVTGGLVTLAGLAGVGLFVTGAWTRVRWAPTRVQAALVAVAVVWVLSLGVDSYTLYDEAYGSLFASDSAAADIWYLLAGLSIVALIFTGLRLLAPGVGSWLIVAATATPLVMLIAELAYLAEDYENPDSAFRLWLTVLPTLALVGLAWVALRRSHQATADDRTTPVDEPAAT